MGPKKEQKSDKSRIKNVKCPYYDRGFCKHGDDFYFKHRYKVCGDQDCSGQNCEKRHPNPCKLYLHVTFASDDGKFDALANKFNKKFEDFENQVREMKKR